MGLSPQRQACGTAMQGPETNHINNGSITMRVERYPGQSTLCPLLSAAEQGKWCFPGPHTLGWDILRLLPPLHPSCRAEARGY